MSRIRPVKWLLVFTGVVSTGLGLVGIFVPLLPTTPFLLLAAACFVRSSERLYGWLLSHKWFGAYIRSYREHRAITIKTKILSISLLWATIGYSSVVFVDSWIIRGPLLVIAAGVTIHLLRLKTLSPSVPEERSSVKPSEDLPERERHSVPNPE